MVQKAAIVAMILIASPLFHCAQDASGYADASCHVSVRFSSHASVIVVKDRTLARQNPDGTFYPGDAFDFAILVSWTWNCWNLTPGPIRASGLEVGPTSTGPTSYDQYGGHYYEYGHAEIGTDASSASISQSVGASGLVCGISVCHRGYTSGSGSYSPQIIRPDVTVSLKFEDLADRDGYRMRNADGTYYVWDGINIVFDPKYRWKVERVGTIDARTDSISDVSLAGYYECHEEGCPHVFSSPATEPWGYDFEYEEGNTVYNSTSPSDIHRHLFMYHAIVYNLGRRIGEGSNSTSALVVRYDPVYANYPYTVLKDASSWWGFGKSPAVALHYYGSVGGGQDDGPDEIHTDRRSKINGFAYRSYAYQILTQRPLNASMTWKGSYQADFADGGSVYHDDALQPGIDSAMFVHAGYGKILFNDPILYEILRTRYDNSTITNMLQSSNFAGYGSYNLTGYTFSYPHTRFSTDVVVLCLHSDGSINYLPLGLRMVPDAGENATYEQDFIRDKVAHDRDGIIAGMVLGDMYGRSNAASGLGMVNMRANLTSMAMPYVYRVLSYDPLDLPLSLVYEQPSPYNVTITAGQRSMSFIETGFQFDTSWRYVVNEDLDNVLNSTRHGGIVNIYPDRNFGPYTGIMVNGVRENVTCTSGCTILLHDRNANATITASNYWGGKASRTLEPDAQATLQAPVHGYIGAALVVLGSILAYGLARRYWRGIASAMGFG